ncbi:MAG: helix-turn-helix domain-containing protein [Chthoniobacterales bacterium]
MKLKNKTSSAVLVNKPLPRLRPKEAAQSVPCSIGTIYTWMDEQRFKHWSVNAPGKRGMRFIDRASFEAFLASMQEGVGA